jgi:alpha-beta hydrolase superfamily lysophospholipase
MNQLVGEMTGTPVRSCVERRFPTHDGSVLFFRHWPAASAKPRGAILLFHRGHEHGGRMAHLVEELALPELTFYAWDARGHGRSVDERASSTSFSTVVRDVDELVRHISSNDSIAIEDMGFLAQSVGAVLVSTWVHDYAPKIRAMVLASPAFSVKLYVPFARPGLRLMHTLRGDFFVNSYVKSRLLTHDPQRIASYDQDALIKRPIAIKMLLGLYEAAERVVRDARAITVPTQLLISGADWVVHHAPQHEFFVNLGAATKERHVLPGFYHDTLGEKDRAVVIAKARAFLLARFNQPLERLSLLDAHRAGYTRDEADRLSSPLPVSSPRGAYWAASRLGLKAGGLLSEGIATGLRTGFDSGSMLDYVYRNEPRGLGWLGRVIDRHYIDAIGWKGICQRKAHTQELIELAVNRLRAAGAPVRAMDIAAGHGRYVLEVVTSAKVGPDSVLLRDYSDINVEAGRRLIAEKGLARIARFEKGDAFDADDLAAVEPQPTLGIVSGLYELFSDNDMIRRSLAGLCGAIPVGGYLVYTCQPWHPQLELLARVLTSHRQGQAWVMHRRTQAEMDQLVEATGFAKIEQRIDEWGIFTVALAHRIKI